MVMIDWISFLIANYNIKFPILKNGEVRGGSSHLAVHGLNFEHATDVNPRHATEVYLPKKFPNSHCIPFIFLKKGIL